MIANPSHGTAVVYRSNSNYGLGIRDVIVRTAMGSEVATSECLARYLSYDSPAPQFAWLVLEEDARAALRQLPSLRKIAEPLDGTVLSMLGGLLLEEGRMEDAIAVLELNVEENPRYTHKQSSMLWLDS